MSFMGVLLGSGSHHFHEPDRAIPTSEWKKFLLDRTRSAAWIHRSACLRLASAAATSQRSRFAGGSPGRGWLPSWLATSEACSGWGRRSCCGLRRPRAHGDVSRSGSPTDARVDRQVSHCGSLCRRYSGPDVNRRGSLCGRSRCPRTSHCGSHRRRPRCSRTSQRGSQRSRPPYPNTSHRCSVPED